MNVRSAGTLVTASLLSFAALAHHGWSGYDSQRTLTLKGTIESANYENPHGTMVLKSDEGTWNVVLAPPSRMTARGLTPEMLRGGATASVEGYPHTEKKDELRAERITIEGKTVELR